MMNKRTNKQSRKSGKKGGALILLAIVVLAAWWSTNNNNTTPPEQGVLDVWTTWSDDSEALQAFFDQYALANGIEVRVSTQIRMDELEETLAGSEVPDLVIMSGADPVLRLFEQGLIDRLEPSIQTATIEVKDFYPATLDPCVSTSDEILCLPWGCDIQALYWNKPLFETAGLNPETPPSTMDELIERARDLTVRDEAGELTRAGFIPELPGRDTDTLQHLFPSEEEARGWSDKFYTDNNPEELDDFVASFTPYLKSSHPVFDGRRMSCQQCHRTTSFEGKKTPDLGLFDGHVAMMIDGSWQVSRRNGEMDGEIGVIPLSLLAPELETSEALLVEGPVVVIPAQALDKDQASSLLAWMMSPEVAAQAAVQNNLLPASRAAADIFSIYGSATLQKFTELLEQIDLAGGAPMQEG
jgi:multiple sugar transport system substrate-binding protein